MKFYLTLESPFHWVVTNISGEVVDHGKESTLDQIEIPSEVTAVIGVAPGQSVTTRAVTVPGKRRANVEAALPYALEESLSEEVEELHFTLLGWQPDQPAEVAIVSKAQMRQWVENCRNESIHLDRIVPEYLLLPLHSEDSCTISPIEDGSIYVRTGFLTGFAIDGDFFEYWMDTEDIQDRSISVTDVELAKRMSKQGNNQVSHWDIGNQLNDWLGLPQDQGLPENLSLLHGEFSPAHRSRNYRPIKIAAACGLLAVVISYIGMVAETRSLRFQDESIRQEMVQLFTHHFPGEPYLGRPRFQLENLMASRGGGGNLYEFQRLLRSITEATRKHNAEIEEVNFRESSMTVLCNVSSLSVLDNIRQTLQQLPGMRAELLSSGARDNKVTGRFRLESS
ncbi:MAG: type II secretion system protein GspL [bacterium]